MSKKDFNPMISIVIPVYNGGAYMREAIDSALSQTYKNVEVLVVNDGSTDGGETDRIARSYGDKIRYFHKENGGVSTALNLGIREMCGEYFSWLSHDDKYLPNKIENQVRLLSQFKGENVLAFCESCQIDKNSSYLSKGMVGKRLPENQLLEKQTTLRYLFQFGTFNGCSLLIPRKAFENCGLFDETLRYNQDSFMWLKIVLGGYKLAYRADADALMRIHDGQLTQRGIDIYHRDCISMSDYLIPALLKISDKKQNYLFQYAKHNAKYNTPEVWKRCICEGKGIIGFPEKIKIRLTGVYGKIRPWLRRIYYKLFKKVKTK